MMWLKGCPRCTGDLYEDKDWYGAYMACLQCGHYLTEAEEMVLRYPRVEAVETPAWESRGDAARMVLA